MPRILISVVCAYWVVGFALRATEPWSIAGIPPDTWSGAFLASVACTLVAVLFLWTAVSAVVEGDDAPAEIAATAATAAIITLAALSPAGPVASMGQLSNELGAQIAALCATYLVVRSSDATSARIASDGEAADHARRMAVGAAHSSMLARLSGRAGDRAGSEA